MPFEQSVLARTIELLGGKRAFRKPPETRFDAHELLKKGLPAISLKALAGSVPFLLSSKDEVLEQAVGISLRTYQRRLKDTNKALNAEQSNRVWRFAEIVAKASDVLGGQERAVAWMMQPAIGLDQRRPIDLVGTVAGAELVEDYLTRMDYGVYT